MKPILILGGVMGALVGIAVWVIPAPTHSVGWFVAHPAERTRLLAWCREHPGLHDANCVAAADALFSASVRALANRRSAP